MTPEQLQVLIQALTEPSWWVKINVIGFLITIVLLAVYTVETARLRRYALLQVLRSDAPSVLVDRLISEERRMILTNVGSGPALNLCLKAHYIAGEPVGKSIGFEDLAELRICDLLQSGKSVEISTGCFDVVQTDGGFTFAAFAEGRIQKVLEENRFEHDSAGLTLSCEGLHSEKIEIQVEITRGRVRQYLPGRDPLTYSWLGGAEADTPLAVLRVAYEEEVRNRVRKLNKVAAKLLLTWYDRYLRRHGKTIHRTRIEITYPRQESSASNGTHPTPVQRGNSESGQNHDRSAT